jgi:hypothetical protein
MRAALTWLVLVAAACWSPAPTNRTIDGDPIRAHFYAARDAFAAMCGCAQDTVAIDDPGEKTASADGRLIRYSAGWFRALVARFGPEAAFAVFAHELAHVERAELYADRVDTFAAVKMHELLCDRRAGCAAAVAGLGVDAGADALGTFLGDIRHFDGAVRAAAFRAGHAECEGDLP